MKKSKRKVCVVSIIGRPNVGKSSLINKLVKYNVAITSRVPQTTRDQIVGVITDDEYQLIFIDTPGIHAPFNLLGESLNKEAFSSLSDTDLVLFLTPINEEILKGDKKILEKIKNQKNKIAVISKIDLVTDPEQITTKMKQLEEYGFNHIISVSEKKPKSIEALLKLIKENYTYESDPLYDEDFITDKPMRFIAKEIIRESALNYLKEELPHSIAINIDMFSETLRGIEIQATIYVKKKSQKGILIGKDGTMIKKIGFISRKKLQQLFNLKVNLFLKIKVAEKWVDDKAALKKFGYNI